MAGVYIHIPFCKQACHYCDFHFSTRQDLKDDMVEALVREMELRKDYLKGEKITTIYLGGGTPSLLTASQVNRLLNVLSSFHSVDPAVEITLEANPDDINIASVKSWASSGINRLSIGIQSFQDDVLKFLNRAHNAGEALESYQTAVDAGIENISIDLMYAIPGNEDRWAHDVMQTLALKPKHISCYALTIEDNTVFGRWAQKEKFDAATEEQAATEFEYLMKAMVSHGYEHYEISNFCLPGFYSRHNSSYWRQEKYLGIGPGAHSYDGVTRSFMISNNPVYIKELKKDSLPLTIEVLSRENTINEYILTTLRTHWGTDVGYLQTHYRYDLVTENKMYIDNLISNNLVIMQEQTLRLTDKGKLLADKIALDLFVEPHEH